MGGALIRDLSIRVVLQPELKWDVVAYGRTVDQREMVKKAKLTLRSLRTHKSTEF